MKLMIASDIHGSAYYCSKLLDCYKNEKADRLLLLGDILYHGPRNDLTYEYSTKDVTNMLNAMKEQIVCVRGNCDAEVDQMVLEFPIMADYTILAENGVSIFASHGHIYNENNLPPLYRGDILINGHTHVPACVEYETYTYMNPGSLSLPKNDTWPGYIVFENGEFLWKDLDGNIKLNYKICEK